MLSLLCLLKFLIFPLTRSGRAGPLLSGQQKVGKDWPKRAAPPLGFPLCGRARVACGHNRARGVTELLAASRQELPGDLRRRCPQSRNERCPMRVRARHDCRTSTASVLGAGAPLPPKVPKGKSSPVTRLLGALAPLPPAFPAGNVCRSCASAHGTTSVAAFAATPSQISRKLLPRSG